MAAQTGTIVGAQFIDELFVGGEPIKPQVGMCFNSSISIDVIATWLGTYMYKQSRGLKYKSSNTLTHIWKCKSKNCSWEIKFTKSKVTHKWKIKHLKDVHINCSLVSKPTQKVVE